jgi:hypothetical protein
MNNLASDDVSRYKSFMAKTHLLETYMDEDGHASSPWTRKRLRLRKVKQKLPAIHLS